MSRLLPALLLLAACSGKDTDTDGPDVIDDTDQDIPPNFIGFTEKPSDIERRGQSLRAGAVAVSYATVDGEWTMGDELASGLLSGTGNFGVILSDDGPGGSDVALEGGRTGQLFLPVVYDDVNVNERYEDGSDDLVLGYAKDRWLLWLSAGAGDEATGWHVVDPSTWRLYGLNEQAVIQLRGLSATGRIQGIYEGDEVGAGVAAVDARSVDGGEASTFVAWSTAFNPENGQFDEVVETRPPLAAFQFPEDSLRYVRMTHRYFLDDNGDGVFTASQDTLLDRGLCLDGQRLDLRYSDTPRTIAIARDLERLGWTSGWRFLAGETEVGRSDLRWVRFGDDCALD
jgi:hypothetical protein